MNVKKLYRAVAAGLLMAGALWGSAGAADPADPAVMGKVVRFPMKHIAMKDPVDTGTLIFSDSPEYPERPGILYGDKVSGDCRVYFYHMNQSWETCNVVVMAYNPADEPVDAVVKGCQYARPSSSIYSVGKTLSMMYYEGDETIHTVSVPAHGYALLGERLDHVVIWRGQLFSGIVDVELPSPMYVSTIMVPSEEDPIAFVQKQIYLPSDSVKLRGTFTGKDREWDALFSYAPKDGPAYIKVGGEDDRYLVGRDVMDNRLSVNVGNYGVEYRIGLRTKGKGDLHLYFNPQGGEYAGVMEVTYNQGKKDEVRKIVELPPRALSIGKEDVYSMQYVDTFKAGTDMNLRFMPPGAANLPVRFIIVPDEDLRSIAGEAKTDA